MKLDYTPGYLVWRLSMKWRAAVDRAVGPLGLTHAQYSLLASLYGMTRGGTRPSQRQLADHTGLEPIFVSKLVRTLEAAGLVRRDAHPDDARAVQLTLTDEGADVAVRAVAVVRKLHEELTAPLGGPGAAPTAEFTHALHTLLGTDDRSRSTSVTPAPTPLTGQDIGSAHHSTRAVLDVLLQRHGLDFGQWAALRTLATRGEALGRPDLERVLTESRAFTPEASSTLADRLTDAGLATADASGALTPTPRGDALHAEITEALAVVTDRIYGRLDPADLATTQRTLALITERARELHDEFQASSSRPPRPSAPGRAR